MKNLTFIVKNMNCSHCISAISKELDKLDLISYEVSLGLVKITTDTNFDNNLIKLAIEEAGFVIEE